MIGLALALQLAVGVPSVLAVRGPALDTAVPLLETNHGAAVALDRLPRAVPVVVDTLPNGHWAVHIPGAVVDLADQVPFARVGEHIIPLASAPFLAKGRLIVPLQVVSELLPRFAPTALRFDPNQGALLVLSGDPPVRPASASAPAPAPPRRPEREHRRRVVVVDAGHGGPDNGMTGPIGARWTIYEKDITLQVAKKLAAALRARGVHVVMTRTTDTLIALADRGRIANEHHGDVFISIHVNAANPNWRHPAAARGYETYFLAEARTEDAKRVEEMENSSVRFETDAQAKKSDPLNYIINDMAQNEHLRESSELAQLIQTDLGKVEPGPSRGVKQAGFKVLVTAYMPAVLVEIGFGTNTQDARFISNGSKQREIADEIADGTVQYLDRYERRLGAATP